MDEEDPDEGFFDDPAGCLVILIGIGIPVLIIIVSCLWLDDWLT